ncbi:hypothetical protein ABH916_000846 [Peribacillus frigoritolerans]
MTETRSENAYIPSLFKPKTTLYLFEIKITE